MEKGFFPKWVNNLIAVFMLIFAVLFLYLCSSLIVSLLPSNVDYRLKINLILGAVVVLVSWIAFTGIFMYLLGRFNKKINWWINFTILIMILFLVIGGVLVQWHYGAPELSLVLRNAENGNVIGNITCKDNAGKIMAGHLLYCDMNPRDLSLIYANVTFLLNDGTMNSSDFSNLTFIAPYNSNYLSFELFGKTPENDTLRLNVGSQMTFEDEPQIKDRKDKMASYLIILLGAVLFSVPSMMNNLKNLCGVKRK